MRILRHSILRASIRGMSGIPKWQSRSLHDLFSSRAFRIGSLAIGSVACLIQAYSWHNARSPESEQSNHEEFFAAHGFRYQGTYVNGAPEGYGELSFPDGKLYKGNFVQGKFDGHGEFFFPNGNWYRGSFAENRFNGYGEMFFSDGARYEGNFVEGECEGEGTVFFPNGGWYKGNFIQGQQEGQGERYYPKYGERLKGNFVKNQLEGSGEHFYPNGEYYQGNYVDGKEEGFGKRIFPNGCMHQGTFKQGRYHGQIKYFLPDGSLDKTHEYAQGSLRPNIGKNTPPIKPIPSQSANRECIVVVESTFDPKNFFVTEEREDLIHRLNETGYPVKFLQVNSVQKIRQKVEKLLSPDEKIKLLWIRAHGADDGTSMHFGSDGNDEMKTDSFCAMKDRLAKDPVVVLSSCSMGKTVDQPSLAQSISSRYGIPVIAPKEPMLGTAVRFRDTAEGLEMVVQMLSETQGWLRAGRDITVKCSQGLCEDLKEQPILLRKTSP